MVDKNKILVVIPARGGSKGIPGKNIKPLEGKPLICYSIDDARALTSDEHICISTDDNKIIETVENYGLKVPFKRPDELATDSATTNSVLLHALSFYEKRGYSYDVIILLQPTSPLRKVKHIQEALSLYTDYIDMVVSVKQSHVAAILCHENDKGFLELTFNKSNKGRQDFDKYYEYNGSIYIINVESLKKKGMAGFTRKKKYVMDELHSVDIDTEMDWKLTEFIVKEKRLL
jgi:CMP-N,N'-diacetyllegionaminic acid synthase